MITTIGPSDVTYPHTYPETLHWPQSGTSISIGTLVTQPLITIDRAENGFIVKHNNRTLVFETYASMTKFLEQNIKPEGDK